MNFRKVNLDPFDVLVFQKAIEPRVSTVGALQQSERQYQRSSLLLAGGESLRMRRPRRPLLETRRMRKGTTISVLLMGTFVYQNVVVEFLSTTSLEEVDE